MELLQLSYFCESAKNENFSHTAKKYGVPTSSVSQSIKRLETELEAELFIRSSNRIRLSARGRTFYEEAREVLSRLENAKERLCGDQAPHGELRLLIGTNRRIATSAIEKYKNLYPEVSFIIHHGKMDEGGDYDFILTDTKTVPIGYEGKSILRERILLAVRSDLLPTDTRSVDVSCLNKLRFISMTERNDFFKTSFEVFQSLGITPNIAIQTDDPFYVRKYVELGLGAALVPEVSWRGYFSGQIVFFDIGGFYRETYLYSKKEKYPTSTKATFQKLLLEAFHEERE